MAAGADTATDGAGAMTNGVPDIWDIYQQMQPGGWSPPPGIEGQAGIASYTSGNDEWNKQHNPQPTQPQPRPAPQVPVTPQPQNQGGNMPVYGENYDQLRKRNQGYFPNANPGAGTNQFPLAPGVAVGNARIAQLQKQRTPAQVRAGGTMINSPLGGSMWVPTGQLQNYLGQGYTVNAPPRPPDLAQSWMQGYGARNPPAPAVVNTTSGNYLSKGGVMNPVENLPNMSPYSTFGSNIQKTFAGKLASGVGSFFANALNQIGTQGAAYAPNYYDTTRTPTYPVQNYQPTGNFAGGYSNVGPRRYFDF